MELLFGVRVMAGMFFLRLVVPLAITLALAYGLHRLDVRWNPDELGRMAISAGVLSKKVPSGENSGNSTTSPSR